MKRNESFNSAAALYDEIRPGYDAQIVDFVIEHSHIDVDDRLFEIAPGTGQATLAFAHRGYCIDAVELGDELAEILIRKSETLDVHVTVSSFEEFQTDKKYAAILCATAFHWLDPEIKYKKCFDMLKEDGYLVLLWHVAKSGKCSRNKAAYDYLSLLTGQSFDDTKDIHQMRYKAIDDSGYFKVENDLDHEWVYKQKVSNYKKGFYSQSSYLSLSDSDQLKMQEEMDRLFEDDQEIVESLFHTSVYIAGKRK